MICVVVSVIVDVVRCFWPWLCVAFCMSCFVVLFMCVVCCLLLCVV